MVVVKVTYLNDGRFELTGVEVEGANVQLLEDAPQVEVGQLAVVI